MSIAKEWWKVDCTVRKLSVGFDDAVGVGVGEYACTMVDDLGPFGFGAHDDTWSLEEERFFLDAAAVGHHHLGVLLEDEHFKIGDWRNEEQTVEVGEINGR